MAQSPSIQTLLKQSGWIQKLAARLVGDPHVAEDLAQDTWVTALEHQPDPGRPMGAWVTTVLRNNLAKLRRRESNREHREHTASIADATPSTLDVVEKAATHRNLVEAVLTLDEPYRTTVLLRFFEQRSYREIAKQMEVTVATVNSRVTRGLERLRQRLDREFDGNRKSWVLTLLPLAQKSAGLPFSLPGSSIMSTTLTVGLVSFAAATTIIVWDPVGEPAAPPELSRALPPATPSELEPVLLAIAAPVAENEPSEAAALTPRSAVEVQDQDEKTREKQEWTAEFVHTVAQLGTTEAVMLNTGGGDIEIVAAQDGNVSFDAKVVADLERVDQNALTFVLEDHITITEEEGTLKIEDAHKGRSGKGWQVNFVLHLPLEMSLNANTGSGDVTVRQVQSDVMVNTGSGDVKITNPRNLVATKLVANTGSGDVHARIRNYDSVGQVSLNSGSGDLTLGLAANTSGEFDLETDSGSIELPDSYGILVEESKGTTFARGTVGSGGGVYKLSSGSGDIQIATNDKAKVGAQ
jgi:RNA polymerase sigma factor (sigma-70 family)